MHRSAPHLARLLVGAAVPVMLVAGCSSGSDSSKDDARKAAAPSAPVSAPASASASPSAGAATPATFAALPDPCRVIGAKTVKSLVPKAKKPAGIPAHSAERDERGGCSWNGLDGYQYRWLDVSLQRYDTVAGLGSAKEQAEERYAEQVAAAVKAKGARSEPVTDGAWDAGTAVTSTSKKDKEEYREVTVVARTRNAVLVLTYNGAGLEKAKPPAESGLKADALKAAKEAATAVAAANA
ncbi:DUF3558 domain-containing protein [Actinacidiphila sp. bgisy167]|uniref:DUF3558 domain-containing protein n=1 Tax=Actinacidiphila sp. bgisy167 TaxID=3413797 RepID=UPI003D71C15A